MTQNADVIIVGGGIIGVTCAWRLAIAGARVTLFERESPGSGSSQAALGVLGFHARPQMPKAFDSLCRLSRQFYPTIIDELQDAIGQRVDYLACGQLSLAFNEGDWIDLETSYASNKAHGIPVERPTPEECQQLAPGVNSHILDALFLPEDAWVDNTALTLAIAQAAEAAGVTIERKEVQAIVNEGGRCTAVRAGGALYPAGWFVLAAGCWSGQIAGITDLPVEPVRGQALLMTGQPIRRVVMSPRGYLVPKGNSQTMLGATVERVGFNDSNTLGGIGEVIHAGLEVAPGLARCEFLGVWSGLRPATPDDIPIIGPFGELPNLIAATGHFRNGILLAPITAAMVRAAITGETPPADLAPFSPDRF